MNSRIPLVPNNKLAQEVGWPWASKNATPSGSPVPHRRVRGWSCCWDRLDRTGEELPLGVVTADVEEGGEVLWLETVEVDLGDWIIHATKIKLKNQNTITWASYFLWIKHELLCFWQSYTIKWIYITDQGKELYHSNIVTFSVAMAYNYRSPDLTSGGSATVQDLFSRKPWVVQEYSKWAILD